jgi:hypothetical protein
VTGQERNSLTAGMNAPPNDDGPNAPESSKDQFVSPRIAYSPAGRLLTRTGRATTLAVWETATGKKRCLLVGHKHSTCCIAFSPDSRTLASSDWDNTIRLWDLETTKELRCLAGHRGAANSLVFTADGNTLISSSLDATVLFWDVASFTHRARPAERLKDFVKTGPGRFASRDDAESAWEMQGEIIEERRDRINPRVVKRKTSKFNEKRSELRGRPPLRKRFEETVVMH